MAGLDWCGTDHAGEPGCAAGIHAGAGQRAPDRDGDGAPHGGCPDVRGMEMVLVTEIVQIVIKVFKMKTGRHNIHNKRTSCLAAGELTRPPPLDRRRLAWGETVTVRRNSASACVSDCCNVPQGMPDRQVPTLCLYGYYLILLGVECILAAVIGTGGPGQMSGQAHLCNGGW
eukprot:6060061-Pyramimonas_sp.AAC.4